MAAARAHIAPTVLDLFAGCGGMTAGFRAEGFDPVLAVEWDLHAAATYAANFGEDHVLWQDIAEVDSRRVPEVDVVIGGPPCQGFSNLGTRDAGDPRNTLWRQYLRLVLAARPKVFIIENVDRFSRSAEFELLLAEVKHGKLKGYDLAWEVLNAADYGVPQRRQRTIVIGSRVGPPVLPQPMHSRDGKDGRQQWRPVRDVLDGLPARPPSTDLPARVARVFGEKVPGAFSAAEIHLGRRPTELSLLRYDCIPPGGGRFDLPDELLPPCWRNKPTGTTDVMGRMRWDQPSLTIRTEFFKPEKGQYLHPQWDRRSPRKRVNRPITHLEAARLQTFPDSFVWCGSKLQIARQIGNAVPVELAAVIARSVRTLLDDT
jgi:DNA (cytosine-5)-methyltransferase 1